ncbi:hypothetical protein J6TS2_37980 [Heyndrickxia sporothermodurans]|nr:hypothetical protein J6TS2_37980 [Heyndrickxia sporothermodurans]
MNLSNKLSQWSRLQINKDCATLFVLINKNECVIKIYIKIFKKFVTFFNCNPFLLYKK